MQAISLSIGLVLAIVFGVAAVMKLRDRAGSRRALVEFGIPARWTAFIGTALPVLELALAGGLVVPATSEASAAAGLVLLSIFIAGIGYSLARGRAPACHCFGQLRLGSAGWPTLVRNGLFAALALALFVRGGAAPEAIIPGAAWHSTPGARAIAGSSILGMALLFVAVVTLTGRKRPVSGSALSAPPGGGDRSVAVSLRDLQGKPVGLDSFLGTGKPLVLIFYAPECGPCRALLPVIGRWQQAYGSSVTIILVSNGEAALSGAAAVQAGTSGLLFQVGNEVGAHYGAHRTPSAVRVHDDGTIHGPAVDGAEGIARLVARAAGYAGFESGADTLDRRIEAALTPGATPVKQPAIDVESLADGGLVLSDPIHQRVQTLNVTAAFIWECCDGEHTINWIIEEMRQIVPQATDVPESVRRVLGQLVRDQLILVLSGTDR